jgi:MFS family permease
MMLANLATFAAGTLVCGVAGNLAELVAGRVIQGAAGGIYPLAFAIIRDRLPRERVPGGIGPVSSLPPSCWPPVSFRRMVPPKLERGFRGVLAC